MKEIMIRETNIDWLKIINLAFKRKDWGKKYTLFSCGEVNINCVMDNYDFIKNVAKFRVDCVYDQDENSNEYYNYVMVEYFVNNYSIGEFKTILMKKCLRMLNEIITKRTLKKAERIYSEYHYKSWGINEEQIEEQGFKDDYDTIMNIENETIQENCLDNLKDEVCESLNEEYNELIETYCEGNKESFPNMDLLIERLSELIEKTVKEVEE